jgi:DNA-binding NtrC family response regulator
MEIDQVKKARMLYLEKGILKRDFVRSEISFSWARSSFQNVNFEDLPKTKNNVSKKINLLENDYYKYSYVDAIVVMDQNGKIIRSYSNNTELAYDQINYDEASLGTNGIGLASYLKKPVYVSKYEHYHRQFVDKLTFGVPHVNGTSYYIVGFILDLTTAEFRKKQADLIELSKLLISNLTLRDRSTYKENTNIVDDFFHGDSEKINELKRKISWAGLQETNVFLCGSKGVGKETVARLIHQLSHWKDKEFYTLYCDKVPSNIIIEDYLKVFKERLEDSESSEFATVYCESIEGLSIKSQELLIKLLECKPVNTKLENGCKSKPYRFILSSEKTLKEIEKEGVLSPKLLNRINVLTINIPSLTEVKEDIPLIISRRIDKYVGQLFLEPIVFSEDLVRHFIRYSWPGNYRELDKSIEQIIHQGRHEKVINQSYLPDKMKDRDGQSKEIISLEEVEKTQIIRALEIMNYNIALTARALKIGRSTLYRKLEKYKIDL